MVAKGNLDTIDGVVDPLAAIVPVKSRTKSSRRDVADPLAAVVPVKSRTNTSGTLDTIDGVVDPLDAIIPAKSRTKSASSVVADPLAAIVPVKSRTKSSRRDVSDPLAAVVPVKSRTNTSLSTCSVATEEAALESRDVAVIETLGADDARDGAGDDAVAPPLFIATPKLAASEESPVVPNPAFNNKSVATEDSESLADSTTSSQNKYSWSSLPFLTRAGDSVDAAVKRTDENIDASVQRTGQNIDAAVQSFYSFLEAGAEKVFGSCVSSAPCNKSSPSVSEEDNSTSSEAEVAATAMDLLADAKSAAATNSLPASHQLKKERTHETLKSQRSSKTDALTLGSPKSMKSQGRTQSMVSQGTAKSIQSQGTKSVKTLDLDLDTANSNTLAKSQSQSGCCLMHVFACSEGNQGGDDQGECELNNVSVEVEVEGHPVTLDEIIGDTLNITSSKVHILDTFSDDNTYDSNMQCTQGTRGTQRSSTHLMTPRAKYLLDEIENIENSLLSVRQTASEERVSEIKKRQDPFIQKMATIKQHLLDQQTLLESAPDDTKKDYYAAISHAAMLNAEVETRRAELELKKIRLESMRVEEEMDRMMAMDNSLDDTFDSLDDTLMTKESEEGVQRAFDAFARYTASKFDKIRKKKNKVRTRPD